MGNVLKQRRSTALLIVLSLAILSFLGYGCSGSSSGGGAVGTAISGSLSLPGSGALPVGAGVDAGIAGATIEVLDGDGNVVTTTTTDANGNYTVRLEDGSYQIGVRLGTVDYFVPARKSVIVQGTDVQGLAMDGGDEVLDFDVPAPTGTDMTGQVQNNGGSAVTVQIIDEDTGLVLFTTTTDASGNYTITDILPVGNYTVRVDTDTLPTGTAAPTPQNISIADGTADFTVDYDLPTATEMNGLISTTGGVAPLASLSPAGDLQPAFLPTAGLTVADTAEVVVIEVGFGEVGRFPIAEDGSFSLNVRDGSYILEYLGLGADVVAPAPIRITIKDGDIYTDGSTTPLNASLDTLSSTAHDVSATLTGTVTLDGTAVSTLVLAMDPITGGVLASVKTTSTGAYELPLADGSYDIILDPRSLPTGVLPPAGQRVAVETGDDPANPFKEESGTADDGVVDFPLSRANIALSGTVTDATTATISGIKIRAFKGDDIVARATTAADGTFTLDLPLGTIDIGVRPSSVPSSFETPDRVRVEITSDGTTNTVTDESGEITQLAFVLEDAGVPNVTGVVTFDFNGDSVIDTDPSDNTHEFVGCRVLVYGPNEKKILFEQPSNPASGSFTFTLPIGTYVIGLDPKSLPPGTAPSPRKRISVNATGVTLADGSTVANASLPATQNFRLVARATTLTGVVTINSRGTSVGLQLVDLATGSLVNSVSSEPVTGAYQMPLFQGTYELKINPKTLPAGTAIPNPVELSVAADGTISTTNGDIVTKSFALTRNVAVLTGAVTVTRGSDVLPLEVFVEVRDPQSHAVLQEAITLQADGTYRLKLTKGSREIAINPDSLPPGVLPPSPVIVTINGTTVTGNGVTNNALNFALKDVRAAGVTVTGSVYESGTGNPIPAELRLFDPNQGSATQSFIKSIVTDANGNYSFKAVDGTYELAILKSSLPPSSLPPANVTFAVQGMSIIESNTKDDVTPSQNLANDGVINFSVKDGATSGFNVVGTVTESGMGAPVPGALILVVDASTDDVVAEVFADPTDGSFAVRLPLGSYFLGVNPDSLPFTLIAPDPVSILAVSNMGTLAVSTDNGTAIAANGDGNYDFDFSLDTATQAVTGTVLDSAGAPIRVFVAVIDPFTDDFVAGRWSDEDDGTFQVLLAPGAYEVKIDPTSAPFGESAPAPVAVTVTANEILEDSGTADDGDLSLALVSASSTISGTVTNNSDSSAIGCFVVVFNAQTGEFVLGAPTDPISGTYSMTVAPGIYEVGVESGSLPPGFSPPPSINIDVNSGDATVDFGINAADLTDLSNCIRGNVLRATTDNPLPAFVVLKDASTQQFILGVPTDENGDFVICVPAGNYRLRVEPDSLPSGTIAPTPVIVQVTSTGFLEDDDAAGFDPIDGVTANAVNDGVVNFRVSEDTAADLAQLTGTVTLTSGANTSPLGAFVFIEETATDQFVNGTFSDPANGGAYTLLVPEGSYRVKIDASTLPPGLALPTPRSISVDSSEVMTVQVNGVPVTTNTVNFNLAPSLNAISGQVTLAGNGFPGFIELASATDPTLVVLGKPTDSSGNYNMLIPNGTYRLRVKASSLPPGIVPPAGVNVVASGGFVTESVGTANDGIISFTLAQSATSLSGYVVTDENSDINDDASSRLFAFIKVFDPNTGAVVAQSPVTPNAFFSLALTDGSYDVLVDPPSLPLDVVPPVPTRISVSGSTVSIVTAGDGQIDPNARLRITATRETQVTPLAVFVEDALGNDVAANVRVRDDAGNALFTFFVPGNGSGSDLLLGNGSFTLRVIAESVPPGFSIPAATSVTVSGGTPSPASVTITLTASSLTGTIFNAFNGVTQLVELDLLDGEGNVLNEGLMLNQSGSDATYTVNLGDGSYQLALRRADGITDADVLLPEPTAISVANGIVQNPDDDSVTAGVQINIEVPQVAATASGTATISGTPIAGMTIVAFSPFDNEVVNETITDINGDYALALPSGFFLVLPEPASLTTSAPTAISPNPYEVEVSATGNMVVLVSGSDICNAATGPLENCAALDFMMTDFNASTDATITGSVLTRANSSAPLTGVAGAQVFLLDTDFIPVNGAVTDANGNFTLFGVDGIYKMVVDPEGIQIAYPTVPAPQVTMQISGLTVTESNIAGTGNAANDGIVNFIFEGATAIVTGQIQTTTGTGVGGSLILTPASSTAIPNGFRYEVPTTPNGEFLMPVAEGNFKLWVNPFALPPGFQPPAPTTLSVSGAVITESNTAGANNLENDGVINPILTTGGGTIVAQVLDASSNPLPAFVTLLQPASNPNDPPFFIAGKGTNPTTGVVQFTAAAGSYFLEIDGGSLPPGSQAPSRVNLSITGDTVTFAAGTETTTVGSATAAVLRISTASTEVRGYVLDGIDVFTDNPVPTVVVAIDVATDSFVTDALTDPATGQWSMTLGNGTYDIVVDPFALPPGFVAPAPVRVSISGAAVTESNTAGVDPLDGVTANASNDGVVNFAVTNANSATTLTGYVRDPQGDPAFALVGVFAQDAAGAYNVFIASIDADFQTGQFQIPIADGAYRISIDPYSIPSNLTTPAAVNITVQAGVITFPANSTEMVGGVESLILALRSPDGGVSGSVLDSSSNPIPTFVIVEDANTLQFMGSVPTEADGSYQLSLPPGTYKVFVDSFALPQGAAPPSPRQITVTSSIVTGIDFVIATSGATFTGNVLIPGPNYVAGVTTIDCSDIAAHVAADEVSPISCSVVLLIPSQGTNSQPTFLQETFSSASTGFFSLPVGSGTYLIGIDGSTLPPGIVPPAPLNLVVTGSTIDIDGSTIDCSNNSSQKVILLSNTSQALTGVVEDPSGNPVSAFIEVVNANNGNFFTGTPNNPSDGSFTVPLGDLTYHVRVEPGSVPNGLIPPGPVTVSTSGGQISVNTVSGTDYTGGVLTITLGQASASVSGLVLDTNGNPFSALITVFTPSGDFVTETYSDPSSGQYGFNLAPGIYEVGVEAFSLPSGFSPPAVQTVNLFETPNSTANFTIETAPAAISGKVFVDDNGTEIGVGAWVEIFNSTTNNFVTGMHAAPNAQGEFQFSLAVGAGSYRIGIDPSSAPAGYVAPPPVNFSVSVNSISGNVTISEDAHGNDMNLADGVIDFEFAQVGATLNGQVFYDDNGTDVGIFTFVFVELNDGTGSIVAEAATDSNGNFSLDFGDGTFLLKVDSGSLPPGFIAGAPKTVVVSGASITIDGNTPADPYPLEVFQAGSEVNGTVTRSSDGSAVQGAFIFVSELATGAFVGGSVTEADGSYAINLADGTFLVEVDPFTLPAGLVPPGPTEFTINGADATVDLVVAAPAGSMMISVVDGQGFPAFVEVKIKDALNDTPVAEQFHSGAPVTFDLPAGDFLATIPAYSVPPGFSAPAPIEFTINQDGTTVDGSGNSSDGVISMVIEAAASSITGTVTFDGSTIAGVEVVALDAQTQADIANVFTTGNGQYELELPAGEFLIAVASGLPSNAVPPAPVLVYVSATGVDPSDVIDFDVEVATGLVSGNVTLDGSGAEAFVAAYANVLGEWVPIATVPTDANGAYALPLSSGSYVVVAELDDTALVGVSELVIAPLSLSADGDMTTTGADFAFFTQSDAGAPVSQVLFGDVTAAGASFDTPIILTTASGTPMALVQAEDGEYRAAVRAGSHGVAIFEQLLPDDFNAPAPVAIVVDGTGIAGTGVTTEGGEFRLDFMIDVDGAAIVGTVTDSSGSPLAGVEVLATGNDPSNSPSVLTNFMGEYLLVLTEGDYEVSLDSGLPSGAVRPLPVEVSIVDNGVDLDISFDGVLSGDGVLDWDLELGVTLLDGTVTIDGAPALAEVVVLDLDGNEITTAMSFNGSFELSLPLGSFYVVPEFDTPQFLIAPSILTIVVDGSAANVSHDFMFVTPTVDFGATLNGEVIVDDTTFATQLTILSSTGEVYAFLDTDEQSGYFSAQLAPGHYLVSIDADDLPAGIGDVVVPVTVIEDEVSGPGMSIEEYLYIRLFTQGTMVSGSVQDVTGQPIAFASVVLTEDGDLHSINESYFATTDAQGAYSMLVPSEAYEAEMALNSLPAGFVLPGVVDLDVEQTPIVLDWVLQPAAASVSGQVQVDGFGTEAEVIAYDMNGDEVTYALTDFEGEYEMALPAGDHVLVSSLDEDSSHGHHQDLVVPEPITVTMAAGVDQAGIDFNYEFADETNSTVLAGRILVAGTPVAGEVEIRKEINGVYYDYTYAESGDLLALSGLTIDQNEWLAFLPDGDYQVEVVAINGNDHSGFPPVEFTVAFGTVLVNGLAVNGTLDLHVDSGVLTGMIMDSFGFPSGHTTVEITPIDDPSAEPETQTTSMDGEFVFAGLSDGTYWVQLEDNGTAQPRARMVEVTNSGQDLYPSTINLSRPTTGNTVSGSVTIDGLAVTAQVYALDNGLNVVATTSTDGTGLYSFSLPEGTYTVMAQLLSPAGDEVAPILDPFTLDTSVQLDIPFTTMPDATLDGSAEISGMFGVHPPVLVSTTTATSTVAVTVVMPDANGDFSVPLNDGDYQINFWAPAMPAGLVSAPVDITVSGATISGTDSNGDPILSNMLYLDPYNDTAAGDVRQVASDVLNAILDGDTTAFSALLHANTMWNGLNAAEVAADFSGEDVWGDSSRRLDRIVAETTMVTSDEWVVWFKKLRHFQTADDGTAREDFADADASGSRDLRFTVMRDSGSSPWLFAGNGIQASEAFVEHFVEVRNNDGVEDPATEEVEFIVEEADGSILITTALVSGSGITNGTLGQDGDEWLGYVDSDDNSGPSPFDATFGSLVDGETYQFTVDYNNTTAEVLTAKYNAPVQDLVPTTTLTQTDNGSLLVQWEDISGQLAQPLSELCLTLTSDPGGANNELMDECGLSAGSSWFLVDGAMLQSNTDHELCVEYISVGGQVQSYCYSFSWPFEGVIVRGEVASIATGPLAGVEVVATDSHGSHEFARSTTNAMGEYAMALEMGEFVLRLDGLPAGSVSPADVDVDVELGLSGDFDLYINGQLSTDGVHDFLVDTAVARLSGQVLQDGFSTQASVLAYIGTTLVAEAQTDMNGDYELFLPEGDVSVIAELSTGSGDAIIPAPFIATIANTGTLQDFQHDFDFVFPDMSNPALTLSGQVYMDDISADAEVLILDDSDNVMALSDAFGGFFNFTLTQGDYTVMVHPNSLPQGFVGTTTFPIEVTANEITGPGVEDQGGIYNLTIYLNTQGSALTGTVTDSTGAPLEGIVISIEMDEANGQAIYGDPIAITDPAGQYAILLPDGTHEVFVEPAYLPGTFVTPVPEDVSVQGAPVVVDFQLEDADAMISGSVLVDGLAPTEGGEVIAYDANGDEVTFVEFDDSGDYTLGLTDGTYTLICDLEDTDLSMVVSPGPVAVTVAGVDQTGIDFDFVAVSGGNATVFTTRVMHEGASVSADLFFTKDIGGTMTPFAFPYTMYNGVDHQLGIALTDGTYELIVDWAEGVDVSNFTPITLVVSAGTITADGQSLPNNDLEISLDVMSLIGRVMHDGSTLGMADIVAIPFDGGSDVTVMTDADGEFMFDSLADGGYWIIVDPASVPANGALPRRQTVFVSSEGYAPEQMIISVPMAAGTLSGVVSVNGTGAPAEVIVLDQALRPVTTVDTDPVGAYSLPLAAGEYSVIAILETPTGVHPDLGTVDFTATATQDIDFDSITAATTLSGLVRFNSTPLESPVIVTSTSGDVVAMVNPSPTGAYTVDLADGDYEVMAWPHMLDVGQLAAPVTINIASGTVTGNDLEGVAIAANTLNIEPYGASDQGQIRSLVADFVVAITEGDDTLLASILHDTDTIFNGQDEATYIADEMSSSDWGAFGNRNDHIVVTLEMITSDEWIATARSGRDIRLDDEGFASESAWDTRFGNTTDYMLIAKRDNGASPWQIAGNGVYYNEISLEYYAFQSEDALGAVTTDEEVEIAVEEGDETITGVTFAGTGVTDGTLFQEVTPDGTEWIAYIDSSSSGPSPFAASLASLVDGGSYSFTINFQTAAQEVATVQLNAPTPLLYPTAEVEELASGIVMISWDEILGQLERPVSEVEVDLVWDNNGVEVEIFEQDGVPFGTNNLFIDGNQLQDGESYILEVGVYDVGGGVQAFELEFDWPLQPTP